MGKGLGVSSFSIQFHPGLLHIILDERLGIFEFGMNADEQITSLLNIIKTTSDDIEVFHNTLASQEITDERYRKSENPNPQFGTYKLYLLGGTDFYKQGSSVVLESTRHQLMYARIILRAKSKLLGGSLGPRLFEALERTFFRPDIEIKRHEGQLPYTKEGTVHIDRFGAKFTCAPCNRLSMDVSYRKTNKNHAVGIIILDSKAFGVG